MAQRVLNSEMEGAVVVEITQIKQSNQNSDKNVQEGKLAAGHDYVRDHDREQEKESSVQGDAALLGRQEIQGPLTPDKTSDDDHVGADEELEKVEGKPRVILANEFRPRLHWTGELHDHFVNAVNQLGGPHQATPKAILEEMNLDGVTLRQVKSHLQKYRDASEWKGLKYGMSAHYDGRIYVSRSTRDSRSVRRMSVSQSVGGISVSQTAGGMSASQSAGRSESAGGMPVPHSVSVSQSVGGISVFNSKGGISTCQFAGGLPASQSAGSLYAITSSSLLTAPMKEKKKKRSWKAEQVPKFQKKVQREFNQQTEIKKHVQRCIEAQNWCLSHALDHACETLDDQYLADEAPGSAVQNRQGSSALENSVTIPGLTGSGTLATLPSFSYNQQNYNPTASNSYEAVEAQHSFQGQTNKFLPSDHPLCGPEGYLTSHRENLRHLTGGGNKRMRTAEGEMVDSFLNLGAIDATNGGGNNRMRAAEDERVDSFLNLDAIDAANAGGNRRMLTAEYEMVDSFLNLDALDAAKGDLSSNSNNLPGLFGNF